MSDRLREALEFYGPVIDQKDLKPIVAAARRFLALTETGPDYEAAKAVYEREFPCHCDAAYLDRGRHGPNCEWPYAEDVSRWIVDAALADYLTEEE